MDLELPGYRNRITESPNQVFLGKTPYDCMKEVIMPSIVRNNDPEDVYLLAQVRAQELVNTPMTEVMNPHLSTLDKAVLLLGADLQTALADGDYYLKDEIFENCFAGDFIHVVSGLISTEEVMKERSMRLPSSWYRKAIMDDVNQLGSGMMLNYLLKGSAIDQRPAICTYNREPLIDRIEDIHSTLGHILAFRSRTAQLSPIAREHYTADVLLATLTPYKDSAVALKMESLALGVNMEPETMAMVGEQIALALSKILGPEDTQTAAVELGEILRKGLETKMPLA
jgi:hypothetical protein